MPYPQKATSTSLLGLLALGLATKTSAHIALSNPIPFDFPDPNNKLTPITAAQFPCKMGSTGAYTYTKANKLVVGQPNELAFAGEASHNGGTCQLAISLDAKPTTDSVWKIIKVFEGGCPAKGDASGLVSNYTYEVPTGFPNADEATFAWTWYNRVGNREIYMNCAPVSISGGSDDKTFYDSLPDMYVINIDNGCTSVDTSDVKIPNPGKFVDVGGIGAAVAATGSGCAAAAAAQMQGVSGYSGGSGNETSAAPSYGGAASTTSAAGYGQSSPAASSSGNDGMYTQPPAASATPEAPAISSYGAASSATTEQPAASYAPSSGMLTITTATSSAVQSAVQSYPTLSPSSGAGISASNPAVPSGYSSGSSGSPSGSSSGSSSSTSPNTTGTCTTNGAVVCNGATQFGLCNNGAVVWQDVAAGTTCENGSIQKRGERAVHRHARAHARVRRQAGTRRMEGARGLREESLGLGRGE